MLEFPKLEDAPNFIPPPVEPPISLSPVTWPYWLMLLIGLSLLLFGFLLYRLLRAQPAANLPAPPLASHVMAMTLLEDLRPQAETLAPQELAARVTEIIRTYLHRQFGILARYRTTQEILAQRKDLNSPPPAPALKAFEDFLLHADSLNYGRSDERAQTLIDEAINTIRKSNENLAAQKETTPPPVPPPVVETPAPLATEEDMEQPKLTS